MADIPRLCDHLQPLVDRLLASGEKITFAGQAWSRNCRIWIYFDCALDIEAIKQKCNLAPCVTLHSHRGTHDGSETGFVCNEHNDGVMGRYVEPRS
jgi:hypothetical protein